MKFFQKYRDRKAAKIQESKARLRQSEKDAEANLDRITLKMLSSPCAINGMKACSFHCVHWQPGNVAYYPDWYIDPNDGGYYYAVRPKCRLWGGK